MNIRKSLALVGFALCLSAQAQTYLTNGLVAYYPFNGNANDASGNGNNGTVTGAQPAKDRFDTPTAAYSFNGLTDYIGVPDSPSLNPPAAVSVSAWIKPVEERRSCGIVSKFGADDSAMGQWLLREGESADSLGVYRPGFTAEVDFVAAHPQTGLRVDYAASPVDGMWHHLMLTYDGAVLVLYKDGKAVVTKSGGAGTLAVYAQAVEIGRYYHGANNGGQNYYYSGLIDDVRIYSRGLSAQEVKDLYTFESAPTPCIPHAAKATAVVLNGFVVDATITDGGCGYTEPPVVIVKGEGTGAQLTAKLTDGVVTGFNFENPGKDYKAETTVIRIASPPFMPSLDIAVRKVNVTMHVVLGRNYVLLSSFNLTDWTQVGEKFTAEEELIVQEFTVSETGRYFKIQEVP